VVAYRVYWGTSPRSYQQGRGSGVQAGATTTYVIGNLQSGRTYYFAATAVDAAGNESDYSSEASKAIP
jgi:fibronectin type 3 domain-containing protein